MTKKQVIITVSVSVFIVAAFLSWYFLIYKKKQAPAPTISPEKPKEAYIGNTLVAYTPNATLDELAGNTNTPSKTV